MSSKLLLTMAVVRANADQEQDYIANFQPFASDRLKSWPEGQSITARELANAVCEEWGIPSFPVNVAGILLRRAEKRHEIIEVSDRRDEYLPNREALIEQPELAEKRHQLLAQMTALSEKVVAYARDVAGVEWSEDQASEALERLCEEFGAEIALARRRGGLAAADGHEDEALVVAHGYARLALERDPQSFDHLVAMVQGTMLVNAIYFPDIGHISNRLRHLRSYLDTRVVLRALGLAPDPVRDATLELLDLLRQFRVPMFVFPHTVEEMNGVLDGIARGLRRGTRGPAGQGSLGGLNREAIDALVRRGSTVGEITALQADIPARLEALGIRVQDTPPYREQAQATDEGNLQRILDEDVRYANSAVRDKDMRSLTAVQRLRGTARPRDLAEANAVFVTTNTRLVFASRRFFREEGLGSGAGHCISDVALTAQLWVRAPHAAPDIARKLLIADCYAALNPSPQLWERWVGHLERLEASGEIDDEQVQALIYHQQARSALFEITHGDPNELTDASTREIIERFERKLREPVVAEARAAEERAEKATGSEAGLKKELADLQGQLRGRDRRDRRVRGLLGASVAVLVVGAIVVLGTTSALDGKVAWATAVTIGVFLAGTSLGWAFERDWKRSGIAAVVFAGALIALWLGVWAFVPDRKADHTKHPSTGKQTGPTQ